MVEGHDRQIINIEARSRSGGRMEWNSSENNNNHQTFMQNDDKQQKSKNRPLFLTFSAHFDTLWSILF